MAKNVLIPIADGSEDIEAVTLIDVFRRAELTVDVASVMDSTTITAANGTQIVAGGPISQYKSNTYDLIVAPGGMPGATNLARDLNLKELLIEQKSSGRLYAAICASPTVVLHAHGLVDDKKVTCYPGFEEGLKNHQDPNDPANRVVVDGNCVTSAGPGTALEFSLKLVELMIGVEISKSLKKGMLVA